MVSTEFLLQAMYGSLFELGLPGKGTYVTKSGLMAPKEVPFPGLYRLWEFAPENMVNYRGSEYSEQVFENLHVAMHTDEDLSEASDRIFNPLCVNLEEDYLTIWLTDARNKQKSMAKVEKEFKQNFSYFLATVKMLSNIEPSRLFQIIDDYFGIHSERSEEFIEPTIPLTEEESLKECPEEIIKLFVWELEQMPSERIAKLRNQFVSISNFEEFLGMPSVKGQGISSLPTTPLNSNHVIGFPNIGNSCYMNATLQALFASKFTLRLRAIEEALDTQPVSVDLINLLNMRQEKDGKKIELSLELLRKHLHESGHPDFNGGVFLQKDAGALMQALLLHCNYQLTLEERRSSYDQISHQQDLISNEKAANILPIALSGSNKLVDLIHAFFNEASISNAAALGVSSCVRRIKQEMPEILVFQLMRYQKNPQYDDLRPESSTNSSYCKLEKHIELPENGLLDMSKYAEVHSTDNMQYRLVGCVCHHGRGVQSGHYTAFVREQDRWFHVNDDLLLETTFQKVREAQHYIYVFEKN